MKAVIQRVLSASVSGTLHMSLEAKLWDVLEAERELSNRKLIQLSGGTGDLINWSRIVSPRRH